MLFTIPSLTKTEYPTYLHSANALRKLYPKHSLVSTTAYDLNILAFPGLTSTPIPDSPLITQVLFAPLARGLSELPGVLVDQVKFGAFEGVWQVWKSISEKNNSK